MIFKMVMLVAVAGLMPFTVNSNLTAEETGGGDNFEIDLATLDAWAAPYRNWHYWPEHVIVAEPNIPGQEAFKNTDVPCVYQLPGEESV